MQIAVNILTNMLVILLNLAFNLYITPLYINKLGLGVYGYVGVITNFISFLSVMTIVLNSMVGRFYAVSINQNRREEANQYISTAFYVGLGLDVLLLPFLALIALHLESFIIVSPSYLGDVRIAFILTAAAFLINVISLVNMTGAYALNRLDINNIIRLVMIGIRFAVIMLLFYTFQAKVYFLGISLVLENLFSAVVTYITFKRLVPDLKYNICFFSKEKMFNLLSSGFFNAIVLLGDLLMSQVMLIVANHTIPAEEVGVLGSFIVILNGLKSLAGAISSAFSPTTLKYYAKSAFDQLMDNSLAAVVIIGSVVGWVVSIFCIMDIRFFHLWLGKDFSQYHFAILFLILPLISILTTSQFHVILQALNKLIPYSFATIMCGIISIAAMYLLGSYLGWGMLGIIIGCNLMAFIQHIFVLPHFVHNYLQRSMKKLYAAIFFIQAYGAIFYLAANKANTLFPSGGLIVFLLEGIVLSFLYWGILIAIIPGRYRRKMYLAASPLISRF